MLKTIAGRSDHTASLLVGSDLHFHPFQRIAITFPGEPDDSLGLARSSTGYVSSIQMTKEAAVKPPATSVLLCTVFVVGVLVPVPGRESLTAVTPKPGCAIRQAVT